jgi:hypothetical protein
MEIDNQQKVLSTMFLVLGVLGLMIYFYISITDIFQKNLTAEILIIVLLLTSLSLIVNGIWGLMNSWERKKKQRR